MSDENLSDTCSEMQRSLSNSLYWYVEKSLDDMLEGFMLLGRDKEGTSSRLVDEGTIAEMNQLINHMMDLPLDFDGPSRQLAVNSILNSVQRHVHSSTRACKHLLGVLLRRKSDITGILKSDLMMILEHIFLRDVKKEDYLKPEVTKEQSAVQGDSEIESSSLNAQRAESVDDEEKLHPKVESRAYAELLVELYMKEFVSATQVLVYLKELSLKQSSFYHTDLLLFLLAKVGGSVESRLSRVTPNWRNGGATPTSSLFTCSDNNRSTFDDIYKRLESLLPYVISPESRQAYDKVMKDRKRTRSRPTRRETGILSRDGGVGVTFRNSHMYIRRYSGRVDETVVSPSPAVVVSNEIGNANEDEQVTALIALMVISKLCMM